MEEELRAISVFSKYMSTSSSRPFLHTPSGHIVGRYSHSDMPLSGHTDMPRLEMGLFVS